MKTELKWISVWDALPEVHTEVQIEKVLVKLDDDDTVYMAQFDPRFGWQLLTENRNRSQFNPLGIVLYWTYFESPSTLRKAGL